MIAAKEATTIERGYLLAIPLAVSLHAFTLDSPDLSYSAVPQYDSYVTTLIKSEPTLQVPQSFLSTKKKLDKISESVQNWNRQNKNAPNKETIAAASAWLQNIFLSLRNVEIGWISPHVTSDEDGNVVFEWWKGDKTFSVYVSKNASWFVSAWGANIQDEMTDGDASNMENQIKLFDWFLA